MATVLLVIHLMVALALVAVVLIQRSEGGALGIGGGGGGMMTGRGQANLLTRATAALAAAFFVTSLSLTLLARHSAPSGSVLDKPAATSTTAPAGGAKPAEAPASGSASEAPRGGILDKLK